MSSIKPTCPYFKAAQNLTSRMTDTEIRNRAHAIACDTFALMIPQLIKFTEPPQQISPDSILKVYESEVCRLVSHMQVAHHRELIQVIQVRVQGRHLPDDYTQNDAIKYWLTCLGSKAITQCFVNFVSAFTDDPQDRIQAAAKNYAELLVKTYEPGPHTYRLSLCPSAREMLRNAGSAQGAKGNSP